MIEIAIYLYIVGYVLAFSFEVMTLLVRLAGSNISQNAYAAFLVTACMLGNRFGASLLFPSGGFLVDKGYPTAKFLFLFSMAAFAVVLVLLLLYVFQDRVVRFLQSLFPADRSPRKDLPKTDSSESGRGVAISPSVVAATAGINQLGLFLPVLVASLFLDYRATIVQLGFIINSVGAIINIFFVERKIALNAEFSPAQLKVELRKILKVRAYVVAILCAVAMVGYVFMS